MSDMHEPAEPAEPTQPLPSFEIASEPTAEPASGGGGGGRGRRAAVAGGVAALVVAALGGAAYAAYSFLDGGGPRPEEALPSSTVAMLSVDLDPHAGQKIEAIKTLRKFPALRKQLGLSSEDDLRRYIVDKGIKQDCQGIDYDKDVKPWVGKRAAFAGVDLGGESPTPAIVLQVEDAAKAKKDFAKLADCAGKDFGYAVGEDYLVASDSTAHAQRILADGRKTPLSEDKTFRRWDDEAGDGVAGFYVAPRAADYLDALLSRFSDKMTAGFTEPEVYAGTSVPRVRPGAEGSDPFGSLHKALKSFRGAAGSLKFADGGMELVVASGADGQKAGKPVGDVVDRLPADTALVLGMSFPKNFGTTVLDRAKEQLGESEVKQFLDEARANAGLDLPGDAEDLLGNAVTLSVGGDAPSSVDAFDDPANVPAALALYGDPDKSLAVLHKVEKALGMSLSSVPVETRKSGDALLLSPSQKYLDQLGGKGGLGGTDAFKKAVPDADHAGVVFFTVIDAGWRQAIVDLASSDLSADEAKQLADNLKPFQAFGLSSTVKDDVARFQLRITTR